MPPTELATGLVLEPRVCKLNGGSGEYDDTFSYEGERMKTLFALIGILTDRRRAELKQMNKRSWFSQYTLLVIFIGVQH